MTVTVREAAPGDRELLARLIDFYLHDFSEFDGRDVGSDGSFHYPWFDAYWIADDRKAYVFEVDGHPAGFALVRLTDPVELSEFFVLRKFRRGGVGTATAREVIARHHGCWTISQVASNAPATAFWRRAIPIPFEEQRRPDGSVEQRFETPPARNASSIAVAGPGA